MDKSVKFGTGLLLAVATLLIAAASAALAQSDAAAGRFIAVTGDVRVLGRDGTARAAERNGDFRQGESIVTGPNGLSQLRMTDGGAVSVRADSQLKLDVYSYSGSDDRNGSFFVSILKGGFRTITGLIARNNRDSYRIMTSSATIGVRGTDFEVVHLLLPLAGAEAGTYNRVYDGTTTFQNRAGVVLPVTRDQTAFVDLRSIRPPVRLPAPPGIFGKPTPRPMPIALDPNAPRRLGDDRVPEKLDAPAVKEASPAPSIAPGRVLTAPLLTPIDSPRVLEVAPTLQIAPSTTISPILTTPKTTISPTLTSPATTTISPILTAPTTTISPILTAPTTTVSPILTAPTTTTTISPILTAPATTIQTAPTNSTIIKR